MSLQSVIAADMPIESLLALVDESVKIRAPLRLEGANLDKFSIVSWHLNQKGYACIGQTDQPSTYHFVALGEGKQRIVVNATNDNFHFMQPVMRLMREQGHSVSELSSANLTQQALLNALRHCDVAWFEWGDSAIIAASQLPKYCRIVCRIHRYELYGDAIAQINWENVDEVILVSQAMKKRFISLLGSKLPQYLKVTVLANLTGHQPVTHISKRRNPYYIACVARFAPQKNLVMLLPILQTLAKKDPRYKLFIAGRIEDQCLYDSFCQLIDIYGLKHNIVICGNLAASEMAAWYSDKSFLLSVSYNESQGMGIFEAMLAGLKPVAFHAPGGLSEYLPANYLFTSIDEAVTHISEGNQAPKNYAQEAQTLLRQQELPDEYLKIWQPVTTLSPLFSIVIPCYNRERYVLSAVSSALNQRDHNFEVVVVDDGSSDASLDLLAKINDPRLRIVAKPHTNAPDTRNRCIAEAKGEYLVWLDSDDILHENALSHYRTLLQRWSRVDVISCAMESLVGEKKYYSLYNYAPANWLSQLPNGNFITNPGSCVLRSLYGDVGGYDTTYLRAHDYEFWSRVVGRASVAFTAHCNISYRLHDGNLTGMGKSTDTTYEYRIFENILKRYRLEALFPGKAWKEIDSFIQERRKMLYAETGVDNVTIILDAINTPLDTLLDHIQLLGIQEDKKFNILVVTDKELPLTSLPVLFMQSFDSQRIKHYLGEKLPNLYHRVFALQPNIHNSPTLISELKHTILHGVQIAESFRHIPF
ncbi:glycosyltransferase [Buttiauxella warmboldiae]|uniref:Glycosyltransferase n=1 Tax=Buttiauxella warmboldiae TaxID=82993 RepID=A0A3N5DPC7_9ENTR|nr:glycosyltransferase [Buttiauxella warmboldiae]RPH29457.1 glycosyltransferase [Buttiauxella warmboldiae]